MTSGKLRAVTLAGLFAVTLSGLSACVTTKTGGLAEKADEQKAYDTSLQLARAYIAKGEWNQAKRHLQYVESVEKDRPETLEALALVFQNTGELELAEDYYKRAIKAAPDLVRTRNNYAAFLYSLERYPEAAQQLEVVVGDLLYERRLEAFVNLGRCYLKLDELDKAENAFRRALLMQGDDPQALLPMAEVQFRQGRYADSQHFFDVYRAKVKQQSAASLWLGIRLAKVFSDHDAYASYGLALKNLYPKSEEYLLYQASEK
jgi:type IV pilus assembly protein PilF